MEFHNLNQAVRVRLCEKEWDRFYTVNKRTFLSKGGVYDYWKFICKKEDFNIQNRYIEDNRVYLNPYVEITFSDRTNKCFYYDTVEEALVVYNEIKNSIKTIE